MWETLSSIFEDIAKKQYYTSDVKKMNEYGKESNVSSFSSEIKGMNDEIFKQVGWPVKKKSIENINKMLLDVAKKNNVIKLANLINKTDQRHINIDANFVINTVEHALAQVDSSYIPDSLSTTNFDPDFIKAFANRQASSQEYKNQCGLYYGNNNICGPVDCIIGSKTINALIQELKGNWSNTLNTKQTSWNEKKINETDEDCVDEEPKKIKWDNGNHVMPNQNGESSINESMSTREWAYDYQDYLEKVECINMLDDKSKIIEFNKRRQTKNYIIVDKSNATLFIYNPQWNIIKSFNVGIGKNKWDEFTMNTKDHRDNNMTGAWIYKISHIWKWWAYKKIYWNKIIILKNEKWVEQALSIHKIPNGAWDRIKKMSNNDINMRRFSNGCINMLEEDINRIINNIEGDSSIYVLPEEQNNTYMVKNNKLCFTTINAQQNTVGKYNYTPYQTTIDYQIKVPENPKVWPNEFTKKFCYRICVDDLIKKSMLGRDEYIAMMKLAYGILWAESNFWKSGRYMWKNIADKLWLRNITKTVLWNTSYNSYGPTQIKIWNVMQGDNEDLKNLFKEYNINETTIYEAENAAIATILYLSAILRNEIPSIRHILQENDISIEEWILYILQWKKEYISNLDERNKYLSNPNTQESQAWLKNIIMEYQSLDRFNKNVCAQKWWNKYTKSVINYWRELNITLQETQPTL